MWTKAANRMARHQSYSGAPYSAVCHRHIDTPINITLRDDPNALQSGHKLGVRPLASALPASIAAPRPPGLYQSTLTESFSGLQTQ